MLEYCTPIIYGSPKVATAYYRKAMNLPAQFSIIQKAEDAEDGRINLLPAVDEGGKGRYGHAYSNREQQPSRHLTEP